jgi:hypothetical protein
MDLRGEWPFWVFPTQADVAVPDGVIFADEWTREVRGKLENGGSVLVSADAGLLANPAPGTFYTVFRGRGLFPQLARPIGIHCDPKHGAPAGFSDTRAFAVPVAQLVQRIHRDDVERAAIRLRAGVFPRRPAHRGDRRIGCDFEITNDS